MVMAVVIMAVILLLIMVMAIILLLIMVMAIVVMAVMVPDLEETLLGELFNPGIHTFASLVCLVPLIKHQANKPTIITVGSGCSVIVAILGSISKHFPTSVLDHLVELTCSITVVLSITILVTCAVHCKFLPLDVNVGEHIIQPLIPSGP